MNTHNAPESSPDLELDRHGHFWFKGYRPAIAKLHELRLPKDEGVTELLKHCNSVAALRSQVEAMRGALEGMFYTFGDHFSQDGKIQERKWCSGEHLKRLAAIQEAEKALNLAK